MMKTNINVYQQRDYTVESQFAYETVVINGNSYRCELVIKTTALTGKVNYLILISGEVVGNTDSFMKAVSTWNCLDEYIKSSDIPCIQLDLDM